jgi:hypothetical protein
MKNDFNNREQFLRELGLFSVEFSQLEFGLLDICVLLNQDDKSIKEKYELYLKLSLDDKRQTIKRFIKEKFPQLSKVWEQINIEIGKVNLERRYLIHGIGRAYLFHEKITTFINLNNEIKKKEFTVIDISQLTSKTAEINTGQNGIHGVFYFKLKEEMKKCN